MAEVPVYAFMVRHAVHITSHSDYQVHVEGASPPPPCCQSMLFEMVWKLQEDAKDMACRGLTFVPPDIALCLLVQGANISKAFLLLIPLLAI